MSIDFVAELNIFSLSVAVSVFFFIAEYTISTLQKKKFFEFSDTLANTACGIIERGIYIVFAGVYYGAFELVYEYRIFTIPNNFLSICVLFILVDFLWYVYHRSGHVVNVLWAAHITHHQSEQYNFTLSYRVSSLQLFIRVFFWMLLPLAGFEPWQTTFIIGINAAYQFFIHTQLIKKLGFLEEIFVTPSHHRVHHGKNEIYIDKNYGGIFIFWDKLFGTFQREEEKVEYGITKSLNSYNPFQAWFHYYVDLYHASKMEVGLANKVKIWFAGPETLGPYYDSLDEDDYQPNKLTKSVKWYLGTQFSLLCVTCIVTFKLYGEYLHNNHMYVVIFFVSYSAISYSAVLENKSYSMSLEMFRILLTGLVLGGLALLFDNNIYYFIAGTYVAGYYLWLAKLKGELINVNSATQETITVTTQQNVQPTVRGSKT